MATADKRDAALALGEEDRLALALIGRGLVIAEEVDKCRGEPRGAQPLLRRLAKAGFLTAAQTQRLGQELPQLVEQHIPGYQLLERLGKGTTGTVYKARQLSMNRLVAVKVLHPRLARDPDFLERFRQEARVAAKFSSNHVVQAIDVGSAGDLHYFVMEYVEGTTVRKELDEGRVFTEHEALEIIVQVTEALDQAHKRGLVHRDIKPANIVLTAEGVAKLADLGLARDLGEHAAADAEKGVMVGTPYYVAPEQIKGRADIDIRADLYSLGATLYHMVTGRPPFEGDNVDEILDKHQREELTPPDHLNQELSGGLGEVVEFLMAKKRKRRYASPEELMVDLQCLLRGEPPRLAREKVHPSMRTDDDGDDDQEEDGPPKVSVYWLAVVGGALGLSLFLNLLLAIRAIRVF
jgi:serine/threonine-protein kinase